MCSWIQLQYIVVCIVFYTVRMSIPVDPPFLPFVIFHIVFSSYRFIFMKACYAIGVFLLLWCCHLILLHNSIFLCLYFGRYSVLMDLLTFLFFLEITCYGVFHCLFVYNWKLPILLCFRYLVSLVFVCDWLIISNHAGVYSSRYPLTVFHSRHCIVNKH